MKKCQYCNAPITKGTYCNEQCRNKYYYAQRCSLKVDNTRIFPGRKQLDNIAMEARKKNMTYGQYRAEQLKEQARIELPEWAKENKDENHKTGIDRKTIGTPG